MREKDIERELVMAVKAAGGMCPKFSSPGTDGMPDRLVLFRDGKAGFVEVKAPGQSPRPLQSLRHRQLKALGFPVFVLDDKAQIPEIILRIKGEE